MKVTYDDKIIGIITEYEAILLGKRKTFTYWYFNGNQQHDEAIALEVFRYAFEKLLHWSPATVFKRCNWQMLQTMHLGNLYKYKICPPKGGMSDRVTCSAYIASKLYPKQYKLGIRETILEAYKNALDGDIDRIPKNLFDDPDGIVKLGVCLQYILTDKFLCVHKTLDTYNMIAENQKQKND